MKIIASYPRSGSTYLRFILANLIYGDHKIINFNSVNALLPTLESETELSIKGYKGEKRTFFKTHQKRPFANVFLVRHIGDVLISEYYFQKKFFQIQTHIYEWMIENNYGKNWRDFSDFYTGCYTTHYEDLYNNPVDTVHKLLHDIGFLNPKNNGQYSKEEIKVAVEKSTKDKVRELEKDAGFPRPKELFVRSGEIGQYKDLFDQEVVDRIIEKNYKQLNILGYEC